MFEQVTISCDVLAVLVDTADAAYAESDNMPFELFQAIQAARELLEDVEQVNPNRAAELLNEWGYENIIPQMMYNYAKVGRAPFVVKGQRMVRVGDLRRWAREEYRPRSC